MWSSIKQFIQNVATNRWSCFGKSSKVIIKQFLRLLKQLHKQKLTMKIQGDLGSLEINIYGRSDSETSDYWDGNWLNSEIQVNIPTFKSSYKSNLRVDDLQRFYQRILALQNCSANEVEFTTMEEGLYLSIKLDYNGDLNCKGIAADGNGNSLNFGFKTDSASLNIFKGELESTLILYPIVGTLY